MKERIHLSKPFLIICTICIVIGITALVYAFVVNPDRAWANYLLNNFFFLSLAIGGTFFLALQAITQAGWSSGFRRISEAMMMYIPVAGILMLFLYFGLHYLYPWSNTDVVKGSELIRNKSVYLNTPFFFIRLILFFSVWILLTWQIRKASLKEDEAVGLEQFNKIERLSKIFIFVLSVTFSLLGFDLLMSIDVKWFSTIYALKNFIASFQHGAAAIFVVVLLLSRKGYFEFLNVSHVHDFARYLFITSIFYGYFWFSQFMLTWYGNLPEETIYYAIRWTPEWRPYWALDIILNWVVPFFVLLPVLTSRSKWIVFSVALVLFVGLWMDLFIEIFPGVVGHSQWGFIEIGSFIGFAGLFALVTGYHLSKAALIPKNHPYIEESYQHHFESYI
ncbi:MAG TPA: hypothetical protein VIH57_07225 [Bacteroidales bacterium]